MDTLFIILVLASLVCLPISLIKPQLFKFLLGKNSTREKAGLIFPELALLFLIFLGAVFDSKDEWAGVVGISFLGLLYFGVYKFIGYIINRFRHQNEKKDIVNEIPLKKKVTEMPENKPPKKSSHQYGNKFYIVGRIMGTVASGIIGAIIGAVGFAAMIILGSIIGGVVAGIILIIIGGLMSLTIIGAILGIPIAIFGFGLFVGLPALSIVFAGKVAIIGAVIGSIMGIAKFWGILPTNEKTEKWLNSGRIVVPLNSDGSINCPSCGTIIKAYSEKKTFVLFGSITRKYVCHNCRHIIYK